MNGEDRLVIVLGLYHSGTTILTYLLRQHPDMRLLQDEPIGDEPNWSLENRWTSLGELDHIAKQLKEYPKDRLLLKQVYHHTWWSFDTITSLRKAKFVWIRKTFEEAVRSWKKPSSLAGQELLEGDEEFCRKYYDERMEDVRVFLRSRPFYTVDYSDFLSDPREVLSDLIEWIGLEPFEFNTAQVSSEIDIKIILGRTL